MATTILIDRLPKQATRRLSLPQKVRGRYRTIKTIVATTLLAFFFATPWIRWPRGLGLPEQAVLFDLRGRRLFVFGLELWPQDLPIAVGALILGAFGLFYATTLAGRVWCGFTCPQTVWTDLFYGIDRLCERLLGRGTLASRVLRTAIWIAAAALTGFGFAAYFQDVMTLPGDLVMGRAGIGTYITIGLLTMTTWVFAGYARERVCLHMCPWPRFQAALLDKDSLVVTYQQWRGEPRGKAKAPLRTDLVALATITDLAPIADDGRGDCIDCYRCVSVCPTGIDIRDGLQMGCIGCGLCVDACEDVMAKIDRPAGLIRFDVEHSESRPSTGPGRIKLFRPKSLLYAALCLVAMGGMAFGVSSMSQVMVDVEPLRNPPFIRLSDGSIRNDYTLRLAHRLPALGTVEISSSGIDGALLRLASQERDGAAVVSTKVGDSRQVSDKLFIVVPVGAVVPGRVPVRIVYSDPASGAELAAVDTYFWGPEE